MPRLTDSELRKNNSNDKSELIKSLIFVVLAVLLLNLASASFNIGNLSHKIDTNYGPSQDVKGWINISFNQEPVDSVFEDSEGNSISLIELIETDEDFIYDCTPLDCQTAYSSSNGEATKIFNLKDKSSQLVGLKFSGDIQSIDSIKFTLQSDVGSQCYNQLKIDIFNDKTADIGNNKINNATACGFLKNYGCFNLGQISANFNVAKLPNKYCQKIKLSPSPGFKIGGWIKNISNTNKKLSIGIYTLSGDELKKCSLPGVPEGDGQETSCDIEYLVMEPEDYYVCIYDNGEGGSDGDFQIKGYSSSENACGYYGAGVGSETASYQIFAEGKRFDSIGTLEITNSLPNGDTLNSAVQEYIAERYGSLDCSINNCVVPINLISEQNQAITLENLEIKYSTISGQITDNKFYDISESVSTLSTDDFQKLKLDSGGFTLPSNKGNTTFELNLNSQKIFSQIVAVGDVPTIKGLTPTTTVAILPTEFEVIVEYSGNITKYEWDFGDGKTQTTSSNKVVHGYNSTGEYELKITVADINQKESSKKFIINVGSPQDVAKNTIDKMLIDLSNVKTQINALPLFQQENLNLLLDIENTEADIMQIQRDYASASSEETYKQIMASLLELDVPESIRTSRSANSVLFYSERGKINLDELIAVAGGEYNYEDREKYIDSIFAWNQENLETKITFEEISAKYENFEIPVLRVFKMDINEKQKLGANPYLIIKNLDNLNFKENYYQDSASEEFIYIELREESTTIEFSTTEDVDFTNLPAFISPEINRLSISATPKPRFSDSKTSKWVYFVLFIILLVIVILIAYIILQQWYKTKYETHLFKNRVNLLNLLKYIGNQKSKGVKEKEIISKLKKAGWNSEQIKYAIRKFSGKRTGMFEIPIDKIIKKFKKGQTKTLSQKMPFKNNIHSKFNPKGF